MHSKGGHLLQKQVDAADIVSGHFFIFQPDKDLSAPLNKLYLSDQATGFGNDDIRGVFAVTRAIARRAPAISVAISDSRTTFDT